MDFDLRRPLGAMFALLGALLVVYGLISDPRIYARSFDMNVNLIWGSVLLVFGGAMLWLGRRGTPEAQRGTPEAARGTPEAARVVPESHHGPAAPAPASTRGG
jgi:hypothetical protein